MINIKITNKYNITYLQFENKSNLINYIKEVLKVSNFKGESLEECLKVFNGIQNAEVISVSEFEDVPKSIEEENWLKILRKKFKLTQQELAKETGLNLYTIQNIEQGRRKGSKETLRILNDFFNFKGESLEEYLKSFNGFQSAEVILVTEFKDTSKSCEEENWLRTLRERHKLTQQELAKETGLNLYTIQNIEQGKRKGSKETLKILINFFKLNNTL